MISIHRVLVPVDLSGTSEKALGYAAELSEKLGAKLTVLYVVAEPAAVLPDMMMPVPVATADAEELLDSGRQAVVNLIAAKNLGRLNPVIDVRLGSAAQEIVAAAKELPADLLVVGTHGRTGLTHLLLGSVAEHVVRHAPCPVMTVRK
ncbi:MAG: universal stress protein [Fimbriiglobus sp.]|nr:universal stress protein [Fimbriiglobus sp.]